jgi:hypothetical protein
MKEKNILFDLKVFPKKNTEQLFLEMECQYNNYICEGKFYESEKCFTLDLSTNECVTNVTYRIVDQDQLSVCISEVSSSSQTIQFGTLMRIKDSNYVVFLSFENSKTELEIFTSSF